ncbi:MAG: ATP-binding protein [Prevotellaceae bacterium]|jgi:nicotinamide riboside kinase|nr:ATP-binding protein [Prevotellaceae bacterium]
MIKVALTGPESTGKTELAQALAEYYDSLWVPEYARGYVENLNRPYTYEDICRIAEKQIEQEKYFVSHLFPDKKYVFFDTELIITKVWFEHVYKQAPDFLMRQLNSGFFDYYLLCSPDLPWEPDSVREHGNDRIFFFDWYRQEIERLKKPYGIVSGFGNERLQCAVSLLEPRAKSQEPRIN